jgi:hypothetical protein
MPYSQLDEFLLSRAIKGALQRAVELSDDVAAAIEGVL